MIDKWIIVRDPDDGELRIVPAKVRAYFVATEPPWEFLGEGPLEQLQAVCRLIDDEWVMEETYYPDMTDDNTRLECSVYSYGGDNNWWRDEKR